MPSVLVKLKPVVRFREHPFGTVKDPSMQEFMASRPWEEQQRVVDYLRSGCIVALPMGADLTDWFDRANRANPIIEGHAVGGTTPMTDGVWFWYAGLIHYIEKYNLKVPPAFVQHAARNNWCIDREGVARQQYDLDY
jgi:hypothetical protein